MQVMQMKLHEMLQRLSLQGILSISASFNALKFQIYLCFCIIFQRIEKNTSRPTVRSIYHLTCFYYTVMLRFCGLFAFFFNISTVYQTRIISVVKGLCLSRNELDYLQYCKKVQLYITCTVPLKT